MKLTIFGATGKVGRPLVEQALAAGHDVTAFVRSPAKLGLTQARLTVVQGDAADPVAVEKAVAGAEAVLSALGHVKGSPPDIQTTATRHILAAMKKYGVRRLVSLTGAGVRDPLDQPQFIDKFVTFLLATFSAAVLADAIRHTEVIKASEVDWVIVRAPRIVEGAHTGKYRVGMVGVGTGTSISRADVADFMLTQASDTAHLRTMPAISR